MEEGGREKGESYCGSKKEPGGSKRAHTSSARQGEKREDTRQGRILIYLFAWRRLHYLTCCKLYVQANQAVAIISREKERKKIKLGMKERNNEKKGSG